MKYNNEYNLDLYPMELHCQVGVMVYGPVEELSAKAKAAAKDKMIIFAK